MESILQKNIKDRLDKKQISVAELERRMGLRHAVINIMHGRSKNPSIRVARAIAKELECSMEDLLSDNSNYDHKTMINDLIRSEDNNENDQASTTNQLQQWDLTLAQQAMEALNKYLVDNKLNPQSTEIFQCVDEIYKYSYNTADKQIDRAFVNWIAERIFIRKLI